MKSPTPRTQVRRKADRALYDCGVIEGIIDAAPFCHVAVALPEGLRLIPLSHVRHAGFIYLHGHLRNAVLGALAEGAEACVSFALLDGLVLGRTAASHSVNYRSVVLYGHGRCVSDPAEKALALRLLVERFAPGRWDQVRPPTEADLASTLVVAVPTAEASAKMRSGPPRARDGEAGSVAWTGVVPVSLQLGQPVPADESPSAPAPALAWPAPKR